MIVVAQIRAARALLNMKQRELAQKANISIATLNNIERGAQLDPKVSTMKAIQVALEKEGIEFFSDAFGSVGVSVKPIKFAQGQATILIIDDSKSDRTLYRNWLSKIPEKHYRVVEAADARAGFEAYVEHQPDCIILDFMMYGTDGFQLLASLKRDHDVLPPIIFVTGMHNEVMEESARAQGVFRYLNKQNLSSSEFCGAVESALKSRR